MVMQWSVAIHVKNTYVFKIFVDVRNVDIYEKEKVKNEKYYNDKGCINVILYIISTDIGEVR